MVYLITCLDCGLKFVVETRFTQKNFINKKPVKVPSAMVPAPAKAPSATREVPPSEALPVDLSPSTPAEMLKALEKPASGAVTPVSPYSDAISEAEVDC